MSKRLEVYTNKEISNEIGNKLRDARISKGYSLGDVADMTGFSKATIIKIEKGDVSSIHYYIAYGQAVGISILSPDIEIELSPRYELSPLKFKRIFLTLKVRELYQTGYFSEKRSVKEITQKLIDKYKLESNVVKSTNLSRVLLNLVEDELLKKEKGDGNKNSYCQ